ncbi:sensor histidine kinase [Chryseobacterium sp.]|uniref:sensor histidine kinase n=1 Tax=Chryseobacterium sp. TaxID=1871047 RepID=UPI002FCB0C83
MKKYSPLFIECIGHILFWSFYLVYPLLIFGKSDCFSFDIKHSLVAIITVALPSYILYFFLLKNIRNPIYWILLLISGLILVYFFCKLGCACNIKSCFINKLIEFIFVGSILVAVFVTKKNIINIKLLAKSNQARADAELKALKAQINPHFLFNTLNMLYSDAIEINEDIADKILKLSDNLHYLIHEGQKKEIAIGDELKFIENYLALQKARMGNRVDLKLHVDIDNYMQPIPPLLLIPFIENAFKYSSMLEEKKIPIFIHISSLKGVITLNVQNKFNPKHIQSQKKEWKDSGIGIENVRQRLEILFPLKHKLLIVEEENTFLVDLIINI